MDLPLILIIIGLIAVVASFFVGGSTRNYSDDLEKVSISLHRETNQLKKRLKVVEEELMIGIGQVQPQPTKVHEIIINQILSLNAQGFSVEDIAKRSSLTSTEVNDVLRSKGVI